MFAKQNAEAAFALASDLANAKDVQQVISLQSRFAQLQMQSYAMQAQELGRLIVEASEGILNLGCDPGTSCKECHHRLRAGIIGKRHGKNR